LSLLSGCTVAQTVTVYKARDALIGMNSVDLARCAGKPNEVMALDDDEVLLQWDANISGNSGSSAFTMALPFGATAKLGAQTGQCHFHASVFRDGTVSAVSFSGPVLADAAAVCSGIVSECLVHPDQTELPKGYDAFKAFLPSPTPAAPEKKSH
jgi:hypothetical protein